MKRILSLCATLLLACLAARAQDAKPLACEDEKQVQALAAECATLVEKAEGKPFPKPPVARIAKRDEVAEVLKRELAPQMKVLAAGRSPEESKAILDQTAEFYSLVFLCKYSWQEKAIYVVPENFRSLSETLKSPKLLDPEMFRAMMLHELVHAHDDLVLDLGAQVDRADGEEKLEVMNALVEGHAQFVAHALLAKQGKSEWFDELSKSISAAPPDADEGMKTLARMMTTRIVFAYEDGYRFFEQLDKAGKLPEFAALVKDPPKSRSAIVNIGEYLGIEKVAGPKRDLKAILAPLAERYKEPDYQAVSKEVSKVDLRAAMTGVPADEGAAAIASIRGAWAFVAASMEGQLTCVAMETADEDAARRWMGVEEKIAKARDEAFKQGQIVIKSAAYDHLTAKGIAEGFFAEKHLEISGQAVVVRSAVGRVGNLVIELIYSVIPIERADVEAWLAALFGLGKPPEPRAGGDPRHLCVNHLRQLGTYIVMWVAKYGNDRDYPGPGKKLWADLLTKPDPKTALIAGKEELLLCPCTQQEGDLQKLKDGNYDAAAYEVTDLVVSDSKTQPNDPIVWEKKASHDGKRNVLLFGGSVVQMTDEELDAANKKAHR